MTTKETFVLLEVIYDTRNRLRSNWKDTICDKKKKENGVKEKTGKREQIIIVKLLQNDQHIFTYRFLLTKINDTIYEKLNF